MAEAERTGTLPDLDKVKAASHVAEMRSVGAMLALRSTFVENFKNASLVWVGNLMSSGLLFQEVTTGKFILSFGFHSSAGLCWEVAPVGPAGEEDTYFCLSPSNLSLQDARVRLQGFCPTSVWCPSMAVNEEDYAGVPTEVCFLVIDLMFGHFLFQAPTIPNNIEWIN